MSFPSQTAAPSSNFKSVLDAALDEYKKKTGNDLLAHWLASELQTCESVDAVLDILRDQAKAFEQSGDQKLMKWIDPVVHVLYTFSGALGDGVSMVFPPAKVIFTGIGVLLAAAKDARASHGAIIGLFERIESFFKRLGVYTQISLTTEMAEVLVKIVIELLSILSIATKEVKRRRAKIFVRTLLGRTDIEDALKRLDSLIQEEVQMAIAQILKATTEVKDGADNTNVVIQQMSNDIEEVKRDVVEVKWTQIERHIHEWLSPPDPYTNYNIACKAHYEGTAAWFFQGNKFQDWTSIGSLLWIHGKPGSGKSILCSAIIKHVMSLRDVGQAYLAFFYFDFRDKDKKQDLRNFVASLLVQLSAFSSLCCKIISRIYSTHGRGTQQPSDDALTNCLREMLSVAAQQPFYIIIDALDECPNTSGMPTPREVVLDLLDDLVRLGLPNLHICVTSRPEVDIKNVLGALASAISLHDETGQKNDISNYVSDVVSSDRMMRNWRSDEKELVIEELSKKADGMFRWIFCQLEVLRHCLPASIRQTLNQLPKSLDETYLRVLSQIPQSNQAHAHRMLQCLVVAVRPLRVEELAELLAFEFDAAQGGIPKYRAAWRLDDQTQAVLSTCSSLVTIIDDPLYDWQVVQFSHFSVKEFLISDRLTSPLGDFSRYQILPAPAHTILTQACLGFLLHLDDNVDEESVKGFPLAKYAARHWVKHAQFEDVGSRVKDGIETLFDSDKPHFAAWIRTYDIDRLADWGPPNPNPNPLYYSALCGFSDLVKRLAIKHPQYVNVNCGRRGFSLLAALSKDHIEIAELLVEHGADIEVRETTGKTPLLMALSESQDNLVNTMMFLLNHGADVNARDYALSSSLHLAEYGGSFDAAEILVRHKGDVNSQDKYGRTPLHIVSQTIHGGHDDVQNHTQLLLEHGADVNRQDKDKQTPLHLTIGQYRSQLVRILLEHGADANAEDYSGKTPLHILSDSRINDKSDIILNHAPLLLKHGADVNRQDKNKQTPLHLAIGRDRSLLARILLEYGADATAEDNNGKTPLHILADNQINNEGDVLDLALLLLKLGAGVNRQDEDKQTPLHLAIGRDRSQLARILLERGADANVKDNNDKTPLHVLADSRINDEGGNLNLALLLLKRGAEVNREDKDKQTPLHLAMRRDQSQLARVLLEHGADANAEDNNGKTPLHQLLENWINDEGDILNLTLLLLEHGAMVNRQDKDKQTPLLLAMWRDQSQLARVLLDHGADANVEDNNGTTPLHLLSESRIHDEGALGLVWPLLEHGAEINRQNNNDQTPLLLAVGQHWFELAQILLDHGADVNVVNNNKTPLHILSECEIYDRSGVDDVTNHERLRLEHGAEVNRRCKDNEASLFLEIGEAAEASMHQVPRDQYGSREHDVGVTPLLPKYYDSDMNINTQVENHTTPSHLRSKFGPVQIAQALLDHGANVNAGFNEGETPSYQESEGVYVQNKNHPTPLHWASLYGRLDIAWVLLKHNATANLKDNFGRTPLHLVTEGKYNFEQDRIRIAQLLLERSVDVNAQDNNDATPLHMASYNGRFAIVRVLLDHGAAANSKDTWARTPLHSVVEGLYLYSKDDGIYVAQLLLERGADVDAPAKDNNTPLHLASSRGMAEMARVLLDSGASTNSKDDQGRTPLHVVAYSYSRDNDVLVAQLLLERGADVNVPDDDNQTPLHLASYHGSIEIVPVLLDAGANVDATNAQGQTPLHLVLVSQLPYYSRGVGVMRLLLEHGADVNAEDKNHATPLDLASHYGMTDIAPLLLHYGGRANVKIDERTPRQPGLEGVHFHYEHRPASTDSLVTPVPERERPPPTPRLSYAPLDLTLTWIPHANLAKDNM